MVYVPAHFQNLSDWVMAVPGKFKSIVVVGVTAVIWSTFETPEMQLCLIMSAHVRNPNVAVYIISHCIESWSMLRKASLRQEHCNAAQRSGWLGIVHKQQEGVKIVAENSLWRK
jgi:hypothetical protein